MLRRFLIIILIAIEQLLKVQALSPNEQSFSIQTCPPNFTRVNNGCYLFNNETTFTLASANASCLNEMASLSAGNFTNSTVHLLAFESLAEVSALIFWFRGNSFVKNFYMDGIVGSDNRRLYSWSGQPLNTFGYLKTNFIKENYTMLFHNGSSFYEVRDSLNTSLLGFICEAQLPCPISNPNDTCKNGGKCYINAGKGLCVCPVGFEGASCEFQIDNCLSIPCKHGGTCNNLVNDYTCSCTQFYEGPHCEKEIAYKYESARIVVMSVSIAIVSGLLIFLSLMDLPWGKITGFLWRDREEHEKKMKEKEKEEKKPKRELKNEKVDSRKLMVSEQEMLNRFKSVMNNNRQKSSSSMVLPNQVAPESNF